MKNRFFVLGLIFFLFLVGNIGLLANDGIQDLRFFVEKYQLPNGLTVILHEDHTVPLVSYHTWFRVGAKDEEDGVTGIAHLFEHMMFKGTKKHSGKDFETILRENGASNNAFTSRDYTGYYINAPSQTLDQILELESDRFSNLIISQDKLKSERDVVKEERRYRVENKIIGLLMEKMNELVFKKHPYHRPVVGYMKDLDNITLDKAEQFYKTFYSPNNAVLVIVGDFDSSSTKNKVLKYYGGLKSQEIIRPKAPLEEEQKKARSEIFYKDIQNDYLSVSYILPRADSAELPAMEIAAQILGEGKSSRLYSRLVYKEQLATYVWSFVMPNKDYSELHFILALKPTKTKSESDRNLKKAKDILFAELSKMRTGLVTETEIAKAQNQIIKGHVDGMKTFDGKAYSLAINEVVLGSYENLFNQIESYMRVRPEDIRKVGGQYLIPNRSNVLIARPEKNK